MNCLVTGAAGFIGSHLCEALLKEGGKVWGMDDLSKGKLEAMKGFWNHPHFSFFTDAVGESKKLASIVEKVDLIYHLAAVVGVKQYVEDPVKVIENNVCQTARLLKLAWRGGKKVVYTSTSEVYGKSRELPFCEEADRLYGSSDKDRWCYAVSKSAAEHLCFGYIRRGLPVVILRYFNVYGPGADASSYGGVVTRFITRALQGKPLTVHGDGSQTRCFTYIDDMVRGTVEAGRRAEAEGRAINLGSRREVAIIELAQMIIGMTGRSIHLEFIPYRDFYGPHYEDVDRRVPDLYTAVKLLDYSPRVSLEQGLEKTLAWYKSKW